MTPSPARRQKRAEQSSNAWALTGCAFACLPFPRSPDIAQSAAGLSAAGMLLQIASLPT